MSQIIPFEFESTQLTVHVDDNGNPWWVASEVCSVLDISNVSDAVGRLLPSESMVIGNPDALHSELKIRLLNESGLYRLIFRSNKTEAKRFQTWIFTEVLPSIRKTGYFQISQQPIALPSPDSEIRIIRDAADILSEFGTLTERDKLMFSDQVRNIVFHGQRLLPSGKEHSYGFSIAERVVALGYRLTRKQEASYLPTLGQRIAKEWRVRNPGKKSEKEPRYVDGAPRGVAWYVSDDASWIDPMVQSYLASLDIFPISMLSKDVE